MVLLTPYLRIYELEHGLRLLEKGYKAARDALETEIKQI